MLYTLNCAKEPNRSILSSGWRDARNKDNRATQDCAGERTRMMEQNQRRRFWMLGPMVMVALLSGVLIGHACTRTGHSTEIDFAIMVFSLVGFRLQKNY